MTLENAAWRFPSKWRYVAVELGSKLKRAREPRGGDAELERRIISELIELLCLARCRRRALRNQITYEVLGALVQPNVEGVLITENWSAGIADGFKRSDMLSRHYPERWAAPLVRLMSKCYPCEHSDRRKSYGLAYIASVIGLTEAVIWYFSTHVIVPKEALVLVTLLEQSEQSPRVNSLRQAFTALEQAYHWYASPQG